VARKRTNVIWKNFKWNPFYMQFNSLKVSSIRFKNRCSAKIDVRACRPTCQFARQQDDCGNQPLQVMTGSDCKWVTLFFFFVFFSCKNFWFKPFFREFNSVEPHPFQMHRCNSEHAMHGLSHINLTAHRPTSFPYCSLPFDFLCIWRNRLPSNSGICKHKTNKNS